MINKAVVMLQNSEVIDLMRWVLDWFPVRTGPQRDLKDHFESES